MLERMRRVVGIVIAVLGAVLAAYSVPFVTFVALGFFLLGLTGVFVGLRLASKERHA